MKPNEVLQYIDRDSFQEYYGCSPEDYIAGAVSGLEQVAKTYNLFMSHVGRPRWYKGLLIQMAGGDVHFFTSDGKLYQCFPGTSHNIHGQLCKVSKPVPTTSGKLLAAMVGELYDSGYRLISWEDFFSLVAIK